MAVEAHHMNLFPSQFLSNREIIKPNHHLLNSDLCNAQMDSALPLPATMPESILPFYPSNVCDPTSAKNSMNKSDSGLTYHISVPRKRSRDYTTELNSLPVHQKNKLSPDSSFLDQDVLYQFQNQQSEIDHVLAHHTEKVRMELGEQKMRQSRMLLSAIQDAMMKKLKEKDEEIQRMGKLNWVLQERINSLCVENQIWRELAQTNETTANYLRSNLEQVLAHVSEDRHAGGGAAAATVAVVADDAESSCGSNYEGTADAGEDTAATPAVGGGGGGGDGVVGRMCKTCGVRESVVLLLPCRHLCLCTMCGSTIRNCPVCHSGMDASLHVNLS